MGWTFGPREKGISTKDYFRREFDGPGGRVLDVAVVGNTAYVAYQKVDRDNGTIGPTYGLVCLTRRRRSEFGYKDMDEGMGPLASNCPRRILDLLSPVETIYESAGVQASAAAWRQRCRTNIEGQSIAASGRRSILHRPGVVR